MSIEPRRRIHCLQHSERVRPLSVREWASERGIELDVRRVDLGELPAAADVRDLIVLGGEMNADETSAHPWLDDERDLLRELVRDADVRILGICLGSQLLAQTLGAKVHHMGTREVGWHELQHTADGRRDRVIRAIAEDSKLFEWHGDTWDLPPGAELMMTGTGCTNQAFAWRGRVYGVQFHPEFTAERTRELALTTTDPALPVGIFAQPELFARSRSMLFEMLDALFGA